MYKRQVSFSFSPPPGLPCLLAKKIVFSWLSCQFQSAFLGSNWSPPFQLSNSTIFCVHFLGNLPSLEIKCVIVDKSVCLVIFYTLPQVLLHQWSPSIGHRHPCSSCTTGSCLVNIIFYKEQKVRLFVVLGMSFIQPCLVCIKSLFEQFFSDSVILPVLCFLFTEAVLISFKVFFFF